MLVYDIHIRGDVYIFLAFGLIGWGECYESTSVCELEPISPVQAQPIE